MKTCSNCGAVSNDTMKFCGECGSALSTAVSAWTDPLSQRPHIEEDTSQLAYAARLAETIAALEADTPNKGHKADILFVLDCTGSMRGEINAIKDVILSFADTIKSGGVRVRVGLIAFRDRFAGEEPQVFTFAEGSFTDDPDELRRQLFDVKAKGGGGSGPESSLDAVMLALKQPFSPDSSKVIVLITDAPPHIPDKETARIEDVIQAIRAIQIDQFYLVIRTGDPKNQVYLKLLEASRGVAFELGRGRAFKDRAEDFKRTLMALGKTISTATR